MKYLIPLGVDVEVPREHLLTGDRRGDGVPRTHAGSPLVGMYHHRGHGRESGVGDPGRRHLPHRHYQDIQNHQSLLRFQNPSVRGGEVDQQFLHLPYHYQNHHQSYQLRNQSKREGDQLLQQHHGRGVG